MVKAADMECVKDAGRVAHDKMRIANRLLDKARKYDRLIASKADDVLCFKRERGGGWWFLDEDDTWMRASMGGNEDEVIEAMIAVGKLYELQAPAPAPKVDPGSDRPVTQGDAW